MDTLTKEYLLLFNTLTDVAETLRLLRDELMAVQRQAEALYISREDRVPRTENTT